MEGKATYIVRYGEVALKGKNKPYFERMLMERIKKVVKEFDDVQIMREDGLVMMYAPLDLPEDKLITRVSKVFGVDSISPAVEVIPNIDEIQKAAVEFMMNRIEQKGIKTFKVEAKRGDKSFPVESPQIAKTVGAAVLKGCKVLKVDVHDPECLLFVHVRKGKCLLY
ncbi:MAG: tRNA 4-thiouridine(8) synthase ThiI, partial [Firmicutes bacterium]|nr:tRNA 4-thiouridine(8) synthase ThiI [Bacillota bacterium]